MSTDTIEQPKHGAGERKLPEMLTTKELATVLRKTVRSIQNYRDQGKIPFIKISSQSFVYEWDQVKRALAKN